MQITDESTKWLNEHCFEYDEEYARWQRDKLPFNYKLYAKKMQGKWLVYARINVFGRMHDFSMLFDRIDDEEFTKFVMSYMMEIRKQPFGRISNYHINFENGVIS